MPPQKRGSRGCLPPAECRSSKCRTASSGPGGVRRFAPDSAPARWEGTAGADYCSANPATEVVLPAARDAGGRRVQNFFQLVTSGAPAPSGRLRPLSDCPAEFWGCPPAGQRVNTLPIARRLLASTPAHRQGTRAGGAPLGVGRLPARLHVHRVYRGGEGTKRQL
jgi:hypothetical protein